MITFQSYLLTHHVCTKLYQTSYETHCWFEDKTKYPKYIEENLPIQKLVGERTKVQTYRTLYQQGELTKEDANEVKCMYWAPKTYQLDICTVNGNVASDEVVVLEKGVLYKQKYVVRKKLFPEGIRSFPFFHFQVCYLLICIASCSYHCCINTQHLFLLQCINDLQRNGNESIEQQNYYHLTISKIPAQCLD